MSGASVNAGTAALLAQEVIRCKRDGAELSPAQIQAFAQGLSRTVDQAGHWTEGQVAAMAMAIFWRGLRAAETAQLTRAMMQSGQVLRWSELGLNGPVMDKHSTGGVGDKVSLMLAPIVAACGGFVPMISGRGLGHTGGTRDKMDAIPGYVGTPDVPLLQQVVRNVGCAIAGQTAELAPADRRLYAIRDVTGTVESVPLITASILSKKLAAGLEFLAMDIKLGNGAFAAQPEMALALARSIVDVAAQAGLRSTALITDMNQVLGRSCGHALEVAEAVAFLTGAHREPRLLQVTRELCAEMLLGGALAPDVVQARAQVDAALASGHAAERFGRMVAALGGPSDFVERAAAYLPQAPTVVDLRARSAGYVSRMATRDMGVALIDMGGGRRAVSDRLDLRVGFDQLLPLGHRVQAGDVLMRVHAADAAQAEAAVARLQALVEITDTAPAPTPVVTRRIQAAVQP